MKYSKKHIIILIVFFFLLISHIAVYSTKVYDINLPGRKFQNLSKEQYYILLSSRETSYSQFLYINNTKVHYAFNLPENSILIYYFLYFICIITFLFAKKENF